MGIAYSQNPAGLTGIELEYWLSADKINNNPNSVIDGSDVTTWMDFSGNGRNFINTEANPFFPRFNKSAMNFHSSVDFYFWDDDDGGPSTANNRRRKLLSVNPYTPSASKSYFAVWISKIDKTNSAADAAVFTLNASTNSGGSSNNFGWTNTGRIRHSTRGTNYDHSVIDNDYGIGIAVLPNSTAVAQQQYLNALASTTTMSGRLINTDARRSTIGTIAADTGSEYYFFGEVMEILVFSKNGTGQTLSADDLKRINSHFAIKYGLTLNANQPEYVLSDGTVVYNTNATGYNTYNKDIFGIARDDAGNLLQKQSASTDNPALTIYNGTLTETNNENTSNALNDKNALMLGANGLIGTSSYTHSAGTTFANYTLGTSQDPITGAITEERLSLLFNYKLRAKATGKTSYTVNVNAGQGEWILVGNDPTFPPATTRIYKLVNGTATDVLINDGEYVGFTSFLKAPAGIANGLVMWLNASKKNTITLNAAGEVINWVDFSGFGTTFSKINSNSTAPLYVECDEKMNFHPSVNFRKSREYLSTRKGPFSVAAPADYSFFSAINANFNTSNRIYFTSYGALTRSLYPALGVRTGTNTTEGRARIYDGGGAGAVDGSLKLFKAGATSVIGHTMHRTIGNTTSAAGNYFRFYADAYMEHFNENSAGRNSRLNGPGTLGYGGGADSRNMIGLMAEHIAYESNITQTERDKIDSYLGLKYAITIDKDKTSTATNFDFTLSDGTVIWPGTSNAAYRNYHNNVASVVRDDVSDLNNKQSRSTDLGAIVHMGVGKQLGCNPDLTDITNDYSALTWGHNDQPVSQYSFAGNQAICGALDSKLNGRIWLVDNTNFSQEVLLQAYGDTFPYNGANFQVYLLVADSEAKLTANNWDEIVPMTFVDGKHQVNYKFTNKRTYFTFAAKTIAVCEGCDFSGFKELDFTRTTWPTNGDKGPKNFNLGNNFNVRVTVEDPNNALRSRYPRASSQKSLRKYRRSNTNPITTKIQFFDNNQQKISSAANFEIFDIDRVSRSLDDVQIIGYCNESPSYPRITYTYAKQERSTYTINSGTGKTVAKDRGVRYSGNVGYTNKRGRAYIEFDYPVQEIHIVYKSTSTASSSNYIGVGKMEFYCPVPPPPPNEDGLIFTKQGTPEVLLCETVDYTFRAINTNCAEKVVTFTDTLPEGMTWVNNSFSASVTLDDDVVITGYGTRTLTVTGLKVIGGASVNTYRASAVFDTDATAKVYENRASLNYESLGTPTTLFSTDRLTGDPFTKTNALASSRPPQIVTSITTDTSCFKLDGEIEVTININNPNSFTMQDMYLSSSYDPDVFALIPNSIQTSGFMLPTNSGDDGTLEFEDFDLPTGNHWVKFKIKASNNMANYDIDPTTFNPTAQSINYELISESPDECLANSTVNSNGEIELSFCSWCTKPATAGNPLQSSTGISVLKENFTGWPENVPNGFVVLEAGKKGMVLTRTTPNDIGSANWVKGMIIYNTASNCISIYNGTTWKCIERACNE